MKINKILNFFSINIEFGRYINHVKDNSLIIFPILQNTLCCGISAIVAFKKAQQNKADIKSIENLISLIKKKSLYFCINDHHNLEINLLKKEQLASKLLRKTNILKTQSPFLEIFTKKKKQENLNQIISSLKNIIKNEKQELKKNKAGLKPLEIERILQQIEKLYDVYWCMKKEIIENIHKMKKLNTRHKTLENIEKNKFLKKINSVLNSLDRLEVRGRDSAGISILCVFKKNMFEKIKQNLINHGLEYQLKKRTNQIVLVNNSITINDFSTEENEDFISISIVYKIAAEIGALGDNVSFLRNQIKNDGIFQIITEFIPVSSTVLAHTRWASVGDITEANCHPLDNKSSDKYIEKNKIIHACLNGDIDNYLELKNEYEERYDKINKKISTDTKIIPLHIEHYLKQGFFIEEAFRLAVNDFTGSHAITMHTDLAPGKLFLAQKGSGQALYVGISPDNYIVASELYGLVEETQNFIKLDGEEKGQIIILDPSEKELSKIKSVSYDNIRIQIDKDNIQTCEITSKDIDRQNYPHFFLKEIFESPGSLEKTLENKFKISSDIDQHEIFTLNRLTIPEILEQKLKNKTIKRICFIGQGTAGVAAKGCADILKFYLVDTHINVDAKKSSELSGFFIRGKQHEKKTMENDLIIAISQSGTTTDTNKTIDMVKKKGAITISIVNKRDSDLTFKTDGVLYTSNGRDVEMSVASTKAFYSQIGAGAILGLYIACITKSRTLKFIKEEINELLSLPAKMKKVLEIKKQIKTCAQKLAMTKNYWAIVGSGFNKTSADEIRIKLSELCYKTISSDFVEDKKHIDLSSEPLIIICAAGTRETVLRDIIKEAAIFNAHKAIPIIITDIGEHRFDIYTENVFKVPRTKEHLAPILNTLVGHLWGYYAALTINKSSEFMYSAKTKIQDLLDKYTTRGLNTYEITQKKKFREKIAQFYNEFSKKRRKKKFPADIGLNNISNLTLALKYLSARLPISDFEIDFGKEHTPDNMLNAFFENINESINKMARPIDAIKHQAKTVTVGTSRTSEKFTGIIFDELFLHNIKISQLTNNNVLVIKNLQQVISKILGGFFYKISGLTLLGEQTSKTKIKVIKKTGAARSQISRTEKNFHLKGTKSIVVREGNVYIGKNRKNEKNILVIPILSAFHAESNKIKYIFSLNVAFKASEEISLLTKIKALGGKYTRIKDIILETSDIKWDDKFLNFIAIKDLFGYSAENIADDIIKKMMP
ncbi:MAG: glutamine--fructose-6-phosphate aminotransferase [Desulfobacteraceae bacterium 4572_130]|nr:MAG: glutamine--fructose-6-phosphate aminotransferase [Desulfobacteraceae bacterium 4572_130]